MNFKCVNKSWFWLILVIWSCIGTAVMATMDKYNIVATNIAEGKDAVTSSINNQWPISNAVNGNLNDIMHTLAEVNPWLRVDLGNTTYITYVKITNNMISYPCSNCWERINPFEIRIGDSASVMSNPRCGDSTYSFPSATERTQNIFCCLSGRYAGVVAMKSTATYLHISELEVYSAQVTPGFKTTKGRYYQIQDGFRHMAVYSSSLACSSLNCLARCESINKICNGVNVSPSSGGKVNCELIVLTPCAPSMLSVAVNWTFYEIMDNN